MALIDDLEPYHDLVLARSPRGVSVGRLDGKGPARIAISYLRPSGTGTVASVPSETIVEFRRATLEEAIRFSMMTRCWNGVPAHLGQSVTPEAWDRSPEDASLMAAALRMVGARDPKANRI